MINVPVCLRFVRAVGNANVKENDFRRLSLSMRTSGN